jgi:hypothetical protein
VRLERERRELARRPPGVWRRSPRYIWESVILFGKRFDPLENCDTPTIELPAKQWFNSLHELPDDGIRLSTGELVTIRLHWSSYFGANETSDIPHLKREAESLMSTKMWDAKEWSKRQESQTPDLDDEGYELPSIIEQQYAVSPVTGLPALCYGALGPVSYKSDSGDNQAWRSPAESPYTFITHWFKSRDEAEQCLAQTAALLESVRVSRERSQQKKQSADGHKLIARQLQARLQLLVKAIRLQIERKEAIETTLLEIEPLLMRTKSSNVIRWSSAAESLLNRTVREAFADDESAGDFVEALFAYVLENSRTGERQDAAIALLDQLDALHKDGKLRSLENRSSRIDELFATVLQAVESEQLAA